jgi:pimeloyl-ACP methyl ester carboxylesterase
MQTTSTNSVVFIHGFLDSHDAWSALIDALPADTPRAFAVDLRGAGLRNHEAGPYTLEQAASDVIDEMERQDLGAALLVGHSMGAQIAERVATRRPDLVATLVLMTPAPLAGNALPDEVRQLLRHCGGNADAQRSIRQMFSRNLPPAWLERLLDGDRLMQPAAVEGYYDAFTSGHPDGATRSRFTGTTHLIGAVEDPVFTPDYIAAERASRFPSAALTMIEQCGHWPHLEQPQRTASVLASLATAGESR